MQLHWLQLAFLATSISPALGTPVAFETIQPSDTLSKRAVDPTILKVRHEDVFHISARDTEYLQKSGISKGSAATPGVLKETSAFSGTIGERIGNMETGITKKRSLDRILVKRNPNPVHGQGNSPKNNKVPTQSSLASPAGFASPMGSRDPTPESPVTRANREQGGGNAAAAAAAAQQVAAAEAAQRVAAEAQRNLEAIQQGTGNIRHGPNDVGRGGNRKRRSLMARI